MNLKAQVNLFKNQTGNIKAYASVVFDNVFIVKNFRVISGSKGLFVSNPSQKLAKPNKNGKEYEDIAYPLTADFRKRLFEIILDEYEKKVEKESENLENEQPAKNSADKGENENSDNNNESIPF